MAELQDPQYLEGGSHTAQGDRLVLSSLVAAEGIVGTADLAVTERAGTADMSVDVAAGAAFIAGTESSTQGVYYVFNDATVNLAVAAADATDPRVDLVVAQVRDAFYSGASDDWQLAVLTGTAAATPAEPAVPDNALVLARIDVAAGAGSVTNADITDRRTQAAYRRALIPTLTQTGRVSPTFNFTPTALSTWEQPFPEVVEFEDLGLPVEVTTTGSITQAANSGTGQRRGNARLEISLDGGATWSEGVATENDTMRNNGINLTSHSPTHRASGTPTGTIQVRMMVLQDTAALGDQFWRLGTIVATVHYLAN